MDDTRDEMRKHYPCAKGSEITKLLGKAWKCLSDEEKEKYAERAREKWRQAVEIATILGDRWRKMTEEQRGHYKRKADMLKMANSTPEPE
eukprot:2829968-Rhodomonas_salina.2